MQVWADLGHSVRYVSVSIHTTGYMYMVPTGADWPTCDTVLHGSKDNSVM
jgi:hypothetical protein